MGSIVESEAKKKKEATPNFLFVANSWRNFVSSCGRLECKSFSTPLRVKCTQTHD